MEILESKNEDKKSKITTRGATVAAGITSTAFAAVLMASSPTQESSLKPGELPLLSQEVQDNHGLTTEIGRVAVASDGEVKLDSIDELPPSYKSAIERALKEPIVAEIYKEYVESTSINASFLHDSARSLLDERKVELQFTVDEKNKDERIFKDYESVEIALLKQGMFTLTREWHESAANSEKHQELLNELGDIYKSQLTEKAEKYIKLNEVDIRKILSEKSDKSTKKLLLSAMKEGKLAEEFVDCDTDYYEGYCRWATLKNQVGIPLRIKDKELDDFDSGMQKAFESLYIYDESNSLKNQRLGLPYYSSDQMISSMITTGYFGVDYIKNNSHKMSDQEKTQLARGYEIINKLASDVTPEVSEHLNFQGIIDHLKDSRPAKSAVE